MLFRTTGIQVHVAHIQRLLYCTMVVFGTAVAGKAIQSTRSTLRTLDLNAVPLLLTAGLSPPFSEPPSCCSARPFQM